MKFQIVLLAVFAGCFSGRTQSAAAQPRYAITDLTERAAGLGVLQAEGTAVNEAGQVVGFEVLPEFKTRAIHWDTDGTASILSLATGDNSSWTHGLNNLGVVAGVSQLIRIEMVGHQIRIYEDNHAATWDGPVAQPQLLSELVAGGDPLDLQKAWDVNNDGWAVGWARPAGQTTGSRGFLLRGGLVTDLGALDNPVTLNHRGQIVGYTFAGQSKAYLWDNGVLTNLHNYPSIGGVTSRAWGINEAGVIVGEAQFNIAHPEVPAKWVGGTPVNLLGQRFGRPQGVAAAVNNAGRIVGWVNDLDVLNDETRAWLLEPDGAYRELIDLVPPGLGWDQLIIAWDVNDRGQITGGGMRFGQLGHAFLLTPIPPPGDLNCDGVVTADDAGPFALALVDPAAYAAAYPYCDADLADLNRDGRNDGADVAPFVAALLGR